MKDKVLVAMSGGVDSAMAAYLLKRRGYAVRGVSFDFGFPWMKERLQEAEKIAGRIGITHYRINLAEEMQNKVIRNFSSTYLSGKTPNPCIRCNRYIKFAALLKEAKRQNISYFSTGHYAKVEYDPKLKRYLLKKGKDKGKDQSYFLFSLTRRVLSGLILPLGEFTKKEIKKEAEALGLKKDQGRESQDICFLKSRSDYRRFLKEKAGDKIIPGEIVDKQARILGRHAGLAFYTIGQRQGLGIAAGHPLYVMAIERKKNRIVVGEKKDVFFRGLWMKEAHFINIERLSRPIMVRAKIRYNHREVESILVPLKGEGFLLKFSLPQFAVSPGQAAVFYDRDVILGGGIIEKGIK